MLRGKTESWRLSRQSRASNDETVSFSFPFSAPNLRAWLLGRSWDLSFCLCCFARFVCFLEELDISNFQLQNSIVPNVYAVFNV